MLINAVDPPQLRGKPPVMSPALQQALSVIQTKKSQLERGESSSDTVPKLIGHIEKMEPGDNGGDEPVGGAGEENIACGSQTAVKGTEEQVGGRQMADKGTEKEKQEKQESRRK